MIIIFLQSSPAPATSGSGRGSWPPGSSYQGPHSPDYPPGGPSTPNSSQGPPSSSANSKLKDQDKAPKQAPPPQKQVELLSPLNTELQKAGSISSLRDALMATTASTTPSSRQYTSYSSPKIEHQASPVTPSGNPMTPESSSVISPQISVTTATRQDSQLLCAGGQGANQEDNRIPYSRQNSTVPGAKDSHSNPSQSVIEEDNGPFQVESILGIKSERPVDSGAKQSSSPVSNSLRDGGEGAGGNLNSPHTQLPPGTGMGTQEGGRSPAPGRPDLLGFPARSPSFRGGEKQPSPLTEDGKTVS